MFLRNTIQAVVAPRSSKSRSYSANVVAKSSPAKSNVRPRTPAQHDYVDILRSPLIDGPAVVVAYGAAGCGKTLLGISIGVEKMRAGEVERLVVTRPAVCVEEEDLGALPGDLNDKMLPHMMPVVDALMRHYPRERVDAMMRGGAVEVCPLAFMRGRTFERAWVVLDEAQNATPAQLLMALTRVGKGSRLVLAGDPRQHDRTRPGQRSGLEDLLDRLGAAELRSVGRTDVLQRQVRVVRFGAGDVQRHTVVPAILELYDAA